MSESAGVDLAALRRLVYEWGDIDIKTHDWPGADELVEKIAEHFRPALERAERLEEVARPLATCPYARPLQTGTPSQPCGFCLHCRLRAVLAPAPVGDDQ